MTATPLTRIKQHLYRQSLAIFGSAALALLLAAALWLGVHTVLEHERANLSADFSASVAYIAEQEQFLRKVQVQVRRGAFARERGARDEHDDGDDGDAATDKPYSLITTPNVAALADPPPLLRLADGVVDEVAESVARLAAPLTDYYTLFWAYSHFPSASLLAFDAADTVRLSIPALSDEARLGSGAMSAALLGAIVAAARPVMVGGEASDVATAVPASQRDSSQVRWLALPDQSRRMVGLLTTQPPTQTPASATQPAAPARLWLATVMSRARLQAQADTTVLDKHQFWLTDAAGTVMLGQAPLPAALAPGESRAEGFSLTAEGLALCLKSDPVGQSDWRGCYRIGYGSFFEDKLWLPVTALFLLLAGVVGVRGYLRWFQRQVIDPAQHTQQALAAANEAKSTFLATMSHEIRTPLYGVLGTLELLARTPLTDKQQQYVARMQGAATLLQQQISDVLDLRSIEAGKMTLAVAPLNIRELVQTTTDAYIDMASRKGLLLACDIAPDVPVWVAGDAARLRQILANLLSNALKFTQAGGVTVRLAGTEQGVVLVVSDTGPGIAPDQLATLFTAFQTANSPGGIHGAGLGLSISQHLAQLMGGSIDVMSQPGAGSTFSLTLALPAATAPQPSTQTTDTFAPLGLRVLVSEDNPINQATLRSQLEQLGCTVTLAADGDQALARWRQAGKEAGKADAGFDLILTDANMPNRDGYALARALREAGAVLPVIGVSANALPDEDARCRAAGMTARLTKPVTLAALYQVLREYGVARAGQDAAPIAATISEKYRAVFHATMQADLTKWQQSLAAGDTARLAQTLHRIRGGLAAVGQTALAAALADIEAMLPNGLPDDPHDNLCEQLARAQAALQTLIDATAPAP